MKLSVNEIFYSLQGEGGRQGEASIFIRLTGCNLRCDFCDTEFETGITMDTNEILKKICDFPSQWIIWTGGEPMLQLNEDVLSFFKEKGYKQAIESNGSFTFSSLLDYTVCSPKGNIGYAKVKNARVNEVRIPLKNGDLAPDINSLPVAGYYFLSPIFEKDEYKTRDNIKYCVDIIKKNPEWRLSLQIHKLIGIE